ncbi:MAG: LON peptidase substrate-binding domain-containing protein [Alphaproteobacteria bacterium]
MVTIPKTLPVFPISGVIVPPGAVLPFNIFEPRYLAMLEDVLKNGRYIIMAQPKDGNQGDKSPELYLVATLCKVVFFDEDSPSRYRITVMGMQRIVLEKELAMKRGYRRFAFKRKDYLEDLLNDDFHLPDRKNFFSILSLYLQRFKKMIDWDDFHKLEDEKILLVVMITFPFLPAEKQALLEAKNAKDRYELLVALLDMAIKDYGRFKDADPWDDNEKIILQ